MDIEVRLFGPFRDGAGRKTVVQEAPANATVGTVLSDLAEDVPELEGQLRDGNGAIPGSVNVTVNKRNVKQLDGAETTLADDDVLRLAPPVAGG